MPRITVEQAIEEIRVGKMLIVVDDEDRENEGDFVIAADWISPEAINLMATRGRGLICVPMIEERFVELDLQPMVARNTSKHSTAFTGSVDINNGCT